MGGQIVTPETSCDAKLAGGAIRKGIWRDVRMVSFQEPLAAIHLLKELVGYIKEKANYDPRLMELVSDIRAKVLELHEENLELRVKCEEQGRVLSTRANMVFDKKDHVYFREEEGCRDGPFCQKCYDQNEKLSRLQREGYGHTCAVCQAFFYDETGRERQSADVERMNDEFSNEGRGAW
jgi:regulator of replication initiation timing